MGGIGRGIKKSTKNTFETKTLKTDNLHNISSVSEAQRAYDRIKSMKDSGIEGGIKKIFEKVAQKTLNVAKEKRRKRLNKAYNAGILK